MWDDAHGTAQFEVTCLRGAELRRHVCKALIDVDGRRTAMLRFELNVVERRLGSPPVSPPSECEGQQLSMVWLDDAMEPEPEPELGQPPRGAAPMPVGQKVLVMSCPEEGTLDPYGGPPYDQKVMDKVVELQQRGKLKFGFDRAGTSTAAREDEALWAEIEELKAAGRIDEAKAKVKQTKWFYGYQSSAKALIKVEMQGFGGVLVVLCIEGAMVGERMPPSYSERLWPSSPPVELKKW